MARLCESIGEPNAKLEKTACIGDNGTAEGVCWLRGVKRVQVGVEEIPPGSDWNKLSISSTDCEADAQPIPVDGDRSTHPHASAS